MLYFLQPGYGNIQTWSRAVNIAIYTKIKLGLSVYDNTKPNLYGNIELVMYTKIKLGLSVYDNTKPNLYGNIQTWSRAVNIAIYTKIKYIRHYLSMYNSEVP